MKKGPPPREPSPGDPKESPLGTEMSVGNPHATFRRVGRILVLGLAAWLFLAFIAIPAAIHLAYRVDIPFLNRLMAGQATTPVSEYLDSWKAIVSKISGPLLFSSAYVLSMATLCAFAMSRSSSTHPLNGGRDSWFRPTPVVTVFCVSSVTALFIIFYSFPVAYIALIIEDGWAEQVQFVSWFTVAFLLGWLVFAQKRFRFGIILFAAIGFLFAMEEISWGQRLFEISTPSVLGQYNYQNELNLHNLVAFKISAETGIRPWYFLGWVFLAWTFLLPAALRLFPGLERLVTRLGIPTVPRYLWPAAMTAAFFLLFDPFVKKAEIGELGAALFCVAVALDEVFTSSRGKRRPGSRELWGLTALIIVVSGLAALSVAFTDQSVTIRSDLNRMAAFHLPGAQMYDQANVLFEYIEAHPEYRSDRSRLNHAKILEALGRHNEARTILERDLASQPERTRGRALAAKDHRITGEILGRLSREVEATQALTRALELDHASLSQAARQDQRSLVRWSLAKTYRLLKDTLAVAENVQAALETPSARNRQVIERWLRENDLGHLVPSEQ